MGFYVCNPLILYIWIDIIFYSLCYDQLVNTNRTVVESSSTFTSGSYSGSANKTIDRKFNQTYTNCMHTAAHGSQAWLKLDLGDIFNLKSVKIWYRNDRGSISTRRLKGFSIFASYNSEPDENDKCYQDTGNVTLKTVLEVNCFRTAQFVKIFTDKINEGNAAILGICEVEIFGCPRKKYGNMCLSCDMCKQDCDITGRCNAAGCSHDGYNPPFCKDCRYGKYGTHCNFTCGHCIENTTCNTINGYCTLNDKNEICEPGWKHERKCDQECGDGTFGIFCRGRCSGHCAGGLPCNKRDGSCAGGCANGWKGPSCSTECSPGSYGKNCKENCGPCKRKRSCDHIDGSCPGLCEPGYHGEKCLTKCSSGRYGNNCEEKCGHCEKNESCHHINGSCPGLCKPGYRGKKCISKCIPGTYGKNCKEICGHCERHESCHHINGSCPALCEPGYQGEKCLKGCNPGRYGKDCKEKCSHCERNESCHHINGSCPGLCEPGYHGEKCLTACSPGRYGRDCKEVCGHCKGNELCHHVNGSCPGLCEPGYHEEKCLTVCTNGWYGKDCKEQCGYCRGNKPCHYVNGSCFGFCEPEYSGEKCEVTVSSQVSQVLANQMEMLKLMRELISFKRRKVDLKENGASPTDFK